MAALRALIAIEDVFTAAFRADPDHLGKPFWGFSIETPIRMKLFFFHGASTTWSKVALGGRFNL